MYYFNFLNEIFQVCMTNFEYLFLISETGCKSWRGQKYVKCPNGDCVLDLRECAKEPNPDPDPNPNPDPDPSPNPNPEQDPCLYSPQTHWRCKNGNCLLRSSVCDGSNDCSSDDTDNSDEENEEFKGCNLYPGKGLTLYCVSLCPPLSQFQSKQDLTENHLS